MTQRVLDRPEGKVPQRRDTQDISRHAYKIAKSHYYLRYDRLSFRMEQLDSLNGFSWKLTSEYFSKICQTKNSNFIKVWQQ